MDREVPDTKVTLAHILAGTADGVFVLDSSYRCILFTPTCERITGYAAGEMLGLSCRPDEPMAQADAPPRTPLAMLCPDWRALREEPDALKRRIRLRRKDGTTLWVDAQYAVLRDDSGRLKGLLGILRVRPVAAPSVEPGTAVPQDLAAELEKLRADSRARYGFARLISANARVHETLERVRAACDHPSAALLIGEIGTGKETVARTIHLHGPRSQARFVALDCSLAKDRLDRELFGDGGFDGLISTANGGTLYLEDVGELPLDIQGALLQVIETRRVRTADGAQELPIDLRIIASTRRPLDEAISGGRFRQELFNHLSVITIHLVPLRERREDIPYLVQQRLTELNEKSTRRRIAQIDSGVWPWLFRYRWPGNIRELNSAVESAFAVGATTELMPDDLPDLIRGESPELAESTAPALDRNLDDVLASVERRAILVALRRTQGQRSQAAREMGISRSRLYRRMEALGIHPRDEV